MNLFLDGNLTGSLFRVLRLAGIKLWADYSSQWTTCETCVTAKHVPAGPPSRAISQLPPVIV